MFDRLDVEAVEAPAEVSNVRYQHADYEEALAMADGDEQEQNAADVADLQRQPEAVAVEVVDDVVLADQVAGHLDVAAAIGPISASGLAQANPGTTMLGFRSKPSISTRCP